MLISTQTARNSEIAEIYRSNTELFVEHADRDFYVLLMFLLFEKGKAEDSFWHEYFETCQIVYLPATWDDEKIEKLACHELIHRVKVYKDALNTEWLKFQNIIKNFPQYFP